MKNVKTTFLALIGLAVGVLFAAGLFAPHPTVDHDYRFCAAEQRCVSSSASEPNHRTPTTVTSAPLREGPARAGLQVALEAEGGGLVGERN